MHVVFSGVNDYYHASVQKYCYVAALVMAMLKFYHSRHLEFLFVFRSKAHMQRCMMYVWLVLVLHGDGHALTRFGSLLGQDDLQHTMLNTGLDLHKALLMMSTMEMI